MIYAFNRVIHILHTNESEARVREFIVPWFICECWIFKFEYLCFCVRIITSDRLSKAPLLSLFSWSLNSKSNKRKLARGEASRKARRRIKEGNALHWRFSNWSNFECLSGGFHLKYYAWKNSKVPSINQLHQQNRRETRFDGYLLCLYNSSTSKQKSLSLIRRRRKSADSRKNSHLPDLNNFSIRLVTNLYVFQLFISFRFYSLFSPSLSAFCNSNRTVNFYGFIGMKLSFLEWLW